MNLMDKAVILVVDDEIEILGLLSRFLKRQGFEVYTANCLEDGKEQLLDKHPNFLFLDVNLPDGNGLKAIPDLRSIDRDVNIVLMSAYNDSEMQIHAKELGVKSFLNKPFTFDEINRIIA
jgi:DNA-binding response OmpR family regulator